MTGPILDATLDNLRRGSAVLRELEPSVYAHDGIGPYYSSIGSHVRHICDVFRCVLTGLQTGTADLTDRVRGTAAESDIDAGLTYLNETLVALEAARDVDAGTLLDVRDDLGLGPVTTPYTLGAALCQAHSHAIHHYACIGYLLSLQGVEMPGGGFGLNPTTPVQQPH